MAGRCLKLFDPAGQAGMRWIRFAAEFDPGHPTGPVAVEGRRHLIQ
jgi:hypothetical protein